MRNETKKLIRRTRAWTVCALYAASSVLSVFFQKSTEEWSEAEREFRYNLVPFVEIRRFWVYRHQLGLLALMTNICGNVIGFVPYGYILPVVTRRMQNGFLIVLSGFCLSLTVETIQLITRVGCFDVDDLILNTLGAALGYLLFVICNIIRRKYYGKKI